MNMASMIFICYIAISGVSILRIIEFIWINMLIEHGSALLLPLLNSK